MDGNQLILGKSSRYLHLEHWTPELTHVVFPNNDIFMWKGTVSILVKRQTEGNKTASTVDTGKTLTSAAVSLKLYRTYTQNFVINGNVSLMWTHRYLKNTLQRKFRNNIGFACAVAESLKINVNIKYCDSVGEVTNELPLAKLSDTCRKLLIIFADCKRAATHFLW
jgi:hypothetical protein